MSVRTRLRLRRRHKHSLRILRTLATLQGEFLDNAFVLILSFQLHSALLALRSLQLELLLQKSVRDGSGVGTISLFLLCDHSLVSSVLDVDSETLGRQETEPLEGLLVEARIGEHILPQRDSQVHDHQAEVVSESVGDEVPTAGEILKPDLWLALGVFARIHVDQSETTALAL